VALVDSSYNSRGNIFNNILKVYEESKGIDSSWHLFLVLSVKFGLC